MQELQKTWVWSLGWEDPWRRKWQPALVLLPGKFHRQRYLVGYSPTDCKELDTTERLTLSVSWPQDTLLFLMETKTKVCLVLCQKFLIEINSWAFIIYLLLCYLFHVHKAETLSCCLLRITIREAVTIPTLCYLFGHTIEMSNNSLRFKDYSFD